ncbi:hypothetical protein RND71_029453 [Anisodus tanguticus]|uniref:ubiquitinyl hydrolase 1 n=1 Tax=Anisodus tanguticus TaxID=243964 RepID=A0AAE1V785_9SOLA|nr:hypothetical protein RND71_029453 [Anisodus tanguticus]
MIVLTKFRIWYLSKILVLLNWLQRRTNIFLDNAGGGNDDGDDGEPLLPWFGFEMDSKEEDDELQDVPFLLPNEEEDEEVDAESLVDDMHQKSPGESTSSFDQTIAAQFDGSFQILEEENNRLIRVYHFSGGSAYQLQIQYLGKPFSLVIYEGETLAQVKVRIQNTLQDGKRVIVKWSGRR